MFLSVDRLFCYVDYSVYFPSKAAEIPPFLHKAGPFSQAWVASILHASRKIEQGVLKP